jgi:hypothetical protein
MRPRPGQERGAAEHCDKAKDNEPEGTSTPAFELRFYLQGFQFFDTHLSKKI